jgi:hypothetical protein
MEDYHKLMEQAARYREMADNDDGWRRGVLLATAFKLECEAKRLKQDPDPPVQPG